MNSDKLTKLADLKKDNRIDRKTVYDDPLNIVWHRSDDKANAISNTGFTLQTAALAKSSTAHLSEVEKLAVNDNVLEVGTLLHRAKWFPNATYDPQTDFAAR